MEKVVLNKEDLAIAQELADLYYKMDHDCRSVSGVDKDRLYSEITRNNDIHLKALELCNSKY